MSTDQKTAAAPRAKSRRVRVQQSVRVDLRKLKLPGPGGAAGWGADLPPIRAAERENALNQLREVGLSDAAIEALEARLRSEAAVNRIDGAWPTIGEDRKVIQAAADLAHALATILDNASPRAEAEIDTALLRLGDRRRIAESLESLARALGLRLDLMPKQSRNRPRVGIVWALDEAVGALLPAPTTNPTSRYYLACSAAFKLAGVHTLPDRAIKRYVEIKAEFLAGGRQTSDTADQSAYD